MSETRKDEEYRALCDEAARLYGWDAMAVSEFVSRYGITALRENIARNRAATPPTPELDAVVARVQRALGDIDDDFELSDAFAHRETHTVRTGLQNDLRVADLRALLAAVSRPAEARGDICNHGRENILECKVCVPSTARERDLLTELEFALTTGDKVLALLKYRARSLPKVEVV